MSRSVPIWRGRTDDSAIPARVKDRILEREHYTCHESGRPIRAGDAIEFDHGLALINGGSHSEDNLFPVLVDKHREKTARDVALKSKAATIRKKRFGLKKSKQPIPGSRNHWSGLRRNMRGEVGRW